MRRFLVLLLLSATPLFADVQPDATVTGTTSRLLIPAAGSLPGAADTYFRSDIRITNMSAREQLVEMIWLPREGWAKPPRIDPTAGVVVRRTLMPSEILHSDDFVLEVLGTEGLGAIVVRALLPGGNDVDPDGKLYATSRIWTRSCGGTMSQSLPAIPFTDIVTEHAVILGHRRSDDFRTNVGIVNLDDTSAYTFVVEVSGENPTLVPEVYEITVPPYGVALVPVQGVPQTRMRIDVHVKPLEGGGTLTLWQAFASTVDNLSDDAWSTLAINAP